MFSLNWICGQNECCRKILIKDQLYVKIQLSHKQNNEFSNEIK